MRRLVIAVDCDDVLLESTEFIVETYNQLYDTDVQLEGAYLPQNPLWQSDRREVLRRLYEIQLSEGYAKLEPSHLTIAAVARLASLHELHVVSARPTVTLPVTEAMLERYFPGCFTSIEHVGSDRSKGEVCDSLGADILIDDNAKHLLDAQGKGVARLAWFGHYPWQNNEALAEGIDRCADWADVERIVQEFACG